MWRDPIVEEIHRIREEFAKEFNYDLNAMCAYFKAKEEESRKSGRRVVSFPPRRPHPDPLPAAKTD